LLFRSGLVIFRLVGERIVDEPGALFASFREINMRKGLRLGTLAAVSFILMAAAGVGCKSPATPTSTTTPITRLTAQYESNVVDELGNASQLADQKSSTLTSSPWRY
jgi:hypothetical protein